MFHCPLARFHVVFKRDSTSLGRGSSNERNSFPLPKLSRLTWISHDLNQCAWYIWLFCIYILPRSEYQTFRPRGIPPGWRTYWWIGQADRWKRCHSFWLIRQRDLEGFCERPCLHVVARGQRRRTSGGRESVITGTFKSVNLPRYKGTVTIKSLHFFFM